MMATELAIGAVIGIVAAIPLMTAQMAGLVMGQQMGLGLASVFNPSIEIEGDNIGQMLFFVAISGFLMAGGLEVLFGALVSTFARVPLGGFVFTEAPLELLVGVLTSGFEIALRVAMPVLVILFMENLAMGFIMKTVPSLNIMTFGFPIKIIGGLIIVIASLVVMIEVLMSQIVIDLELIQEWAWSL
jgi:flagellar biosynthesis protein FliR